MQAKHTPRSSPLEATEVRREWLVAGVCDMCDEWAELGREGMEKPRMPREAAKPRKVALLCCSCCWEAGCFRVAELAGQGSLVRRRDGANSHAGESSCMAGCDAQGQTSATAAMAFVSLSSSARPSLRSAAMARRERRRRRAATM